MRVAVGISAGVQGGIYLANDNDITVWIWFIGLLMMASGASLLIGFLTPVAGGLAGLGSLGCWLSWFPSSTPNLFDRFLPVALMIVMVAAIVLLGPGAFSLDARLFGRREIIIPSNPPSSNS